jgi:HPt (histidine-containing phosphotransfer) domain-containing protein
MGKPDFAARVLEKFRATAPEEIDAVAAAVASGDAAELKAAAHRLKGAAANVTAEAIRREAELLEQMGVSGHLATASAALDRLRNAFDRLEECLKDCTVTAGASAGRNQS